MTTATTTQLRRCIGSKTFGVEAHEAPADDFPTQPSQKDGLGRMCKPHWRQYTNALRNAAVAREAAGADTAEPEPVPEAEPEKSVAEAESRERQSSRSAKAKPAPQPAAAAG